MSEPGARFTEADLAPSDEEKRATRRFILDRAAATIAVLAAGVWVGGMIALGACAAPFVFRLTPAPFSGDAMGAAFARFDQIAIGASVVILAGEVARTWAAGRKGRSAAARVRRVIAVIMAASAAYIGLTLTPQIIELHRSGVRRNVGDDGVMLERIHKRAELVGKVEVALGAGLIGLHVFTLGAARPDDDDFEDAIAPGAPGGR